MESQYTTNYSGEITNQSFCSPVSMLFIVLFTWEGFEAGNGDGIGGITDSWGGRELWLRWLRFDLWLIAKQWLYRRSYQKETLLSLKWPVRFDRQHYLT